MSVSSLLWRNAFGRIVHWDLSRSRMKKQRRSLQIRLRLLRRYLRLSLYTHIVLSLYTHIVRTRQDSVACHVLCLRFLYLNLHLLCLQMFGGLVQGALGTMTGEAVATEVMLFFFHMCIAGFPNPSKSPIVDYTHVFSY